MLRPIFIYFWSRVCGFRRVYANTHPLRTVITLLVRSYKKPLFTHHSTAQGLSECHFKATLSVHTHLTMSQIQYSLVYVHIAFTVIHILYIERITLINFQRINHCEEV